MRAALSLLVYLIVVFLGGAVLAPCLWWSAQWGAGHWPAMSRLAANPFHRFLDRSLLGLAVLGVWPLARSAGMANWADLGFVKHKQAPLDFLRGFALGWASLAWVALLAVVCHARIWIPSHSSAGIGRHLLNATVSALLVAILEELLFRGALFGLLRKSMPWPAALAVSSAIYSLAHFIGSAELPGPVHWDSGLVLLGEMFRQSPPLIPSFFTLFVVGAILALAYQRSGALYLSIGLHAGWIFWLKSYRLLLQQTGPGQPFWGSDNLIDGWVSLLVLIVVFVLVALRARPSHLARQKASAHS
jgi:uncharacterized protein